MRLRVPGSRFLAESRQRFIAYWLDRRVPPEPAQVRLHRNRLFILPTPLGYLFAITLFTLLLGSLNYGTSLGFAITFLLGGAGTLAMLHTYRNLEGMTLSFAPAQPVFAGERARFPVRIEAGDRARWALELGIPEETGEGLMSAPGEPQLTHIGLQTRTRGRQGLPRLTITTRWPLALFRVWSWLWPTVECLVYPMPVDHGHALPTPSDGGDSGRKSAVGDEDFSGLREYRPGDPSRRIAWKALARSDQLLVKAFEAEPSGDTWLAWDVLTSLESEARFEQLAAWVLAAEQAGRRYGLRLPDNRIAPAHGPDHRRRCLEALALSLPESA